MHQTISSMFPGAEMTFYTGDEQERKNGWLFCFEPSSSSAKDLQTLQDSVHFPV